MIIAVPVGSYLRFDPITTMIGLDVDGSEMYVSNDAKAIKNGAEYITYDMQPSYEQSQAVLSEGGFIFAGQPELRTWLNTL